VSDHTTVRTRPRRPAAARAETETGEIRDETSGVQINPIFEEEDLRTMFVMFDVKSSGCTPSFRSRQPPATDVRPQCRRS